jgi:hypothetical protein
MGANDDDDWEEVWDARMAALERVFGSSREEVYHAPHPFALGGQADVVAFSMQPQGVAYVTAELSGKPDASYADYELMICHRKDDSWGPNVISRLAPYTQEAYIHASDSMDIGEATPKDSTIKAFLFDDYGSFELFGETFQLRLCLGITQDELEFKLKVGAEQLLTALKASGIYPYTDLRRSSVLTK